MSGVSDTPSRVRVTERVTVSRLPTARLRLPNSWSSNVCTQALAAPTRIYIFSYASVSSLVSDIPLASGNSTAAANLGMEGAG